MSADPLTRLRAMEDAVGTDTPPSPEEIVKFCQSLRANPNQIPREDVKAVVATLERLARWAAEQRDAFAEELSRLGEGRRAMRGYSTLRSAKTSQRLRREA